VKLSSRQMMNACCRNLKSKKIKYKYNENNYLVYNVVNLNGDYERILVDKQNMCRFYKLYLKENDKFITEGHSQCKYR
ncbi:MAG: hypothetical protein MHPSP_001302, partial [Paramarteilia canceri]